MGARAEYSRWGGITAPTFVSRSNLAGRSKQGTIFLLFIRRIAPGNPCAAGRLTAFEADFSDAIDGAASFSARLTEALSGAGAFSEARVAGSAATGRARAG